MPPMAQKAGGTRSREPETLPGTLLEEDNADAEVDPSDIHEEVDDFAAIDKLLEATDHGWGLDDQVKSLRQVVADTRPPETAPAPEPDVAPRPSQPPRKPPPGAAPAAGRGDLPRAPADMADAGALVNLLHSRLATLETMSDPVGIARLHMELAVASEFILGDDLRATTHAEAALRSSPTSAAAHAMLRRKRHGRAALAAMLGHLEQELAAATNEATKVELLAEKARLLEATGNQGRRRGRPGSSR